MIYPIVYRMEHTVAGGAVSGKVLGRRDRGRGEEGRAVSA